MTETIERAATGLDVLEHLDFDPEPPCEHSNHGKTRWHQGPGEILLANTGNRCSGCGYTIRATHMLICRPAFEHANRVGFRCDQCRTVHPRDHWWTVVGGVR